MYEDTIQALDEALQINPSRKDALYNKGSALCHLGKYDDAIKAFDQAINIDPNDSIAWHNKGTALKLLGRTTEAEAALANAKELGYKG